MNEICMSRRAALAMIAGAMPATFFLYGCSSSSGSGGSNPPPLTPTPTQARPAYHLTPASGWINDPVRPLWMGGIWNLWVLWNTDFPTGNGTAWRRYTSSDLVNWTDEGVSIPKYTTAYGDVWGGSSVVDTNNTAGYGAGAVIALMTMPCNSLGGQGTGLWYSTNGGVSFQFGSIVQTNPLAGNTSISDLVFRDPSVFWYAPANRWIMNLAEVGKLSIYTSTDLKTWTYQSAMIRSDLGTMECPHLFPLHLYNADGTTGQDKWVLLCGANGTAAGFTTGTQYWVGSFDGTTFTPDDWTGNWLDAGPDFYATTVFADANAADPLAYAYAIAWENNWDYAKAMPTSDYYGQLSIMRQLILQIVSGRPVLVNKSITAQTSIFKSTVQGSNQTISGVTPYSWPSWTGNPSCRIDFTLSSVNGSWPSEIDLTLRSGDGDLTKLVFQPSQSIVALNRSQCGKAPISDAAWNTVRQAVCDFSAPVSVSVFVDSGSVEVFLNGGEQAISTLITTPSDTTGVALSASGGSAAISSLQIASLS